MNPYITPGCKSSPPSNLTWNELDPFVEDPLGGPGFGLQFKFCRTVDAPKPGRGPLVFQETVQRGLKPPQNMAVEEEKALNGPNKHLLAFGRLIL